VDAKTESVPGCSQLLDKFLQVFRDSYDIQKDYTAGNTTYDAYAYLNVRNARYVLTKKAELWRADCFEHVFFLCRERIEAADIENFRQSIPTEIEPQLVRQGRETMPEDHMYSFITGIFISRQPVSGETRQAVRRLRFYKNYRLALRGYCQARAVVLDLAEGSVCGNPPAHDLIKGYGKMLKASFFTGSSS